MSGCGPGDSGKRRRRLRPAGVYRQLRSFQVATLIYDGTVSFCNRFVDGRSRTHDQMVQAARSGRQNIAEGNRAAAVSSKSELHLTNVARASLEELLLDFEDYLRQNGLPLWDPDGREAGEVRALRRAGDRKDRSDLRDPTDRGARARYAHYRPFLENPEATVVANTILCLIHQANYLLDQQLVGLEQEFIEGGGYTEQLAAARLAHQKGGDPTDPTDRDFPRCPQCGELMVLRTARQGKNSGSQFWGCTAYPECKGALPYERDRSDPTDPTDPADRAK